MLSYFGGKGSLAKLYPPPIHETIVEPFAGGASYSLRYHHRKVVLIEKYEKLYKLWCWLIEEATKKEILSLPSKVHDVHDLDICEGAKYLIGYWLNLVHCSPCRRPSAWVRERMAINKPFTNGWGPLIRGRIADQVEHIKHWRVIHGDFSQATDLVEGPVTWFIDPPYQTSGSKYPEGAKKIDFDALADWCQSLEGQVIVCEQEGSDWLPFRSLATFSRGGLKGAKSGREVIWLNDWDGYRERPKGFGVANNMVHVQDIPQNEAWQKQAKRKKKRGKA